MNKSSQRQFLLNRCLVVIGMMGAGKTSVGRELARRANAPFYDADREIEKAAGQSVQEIFAAYGEKEFRRMERDIVARLVALSPAVLSLGGGAFVNAETREHIKSSGGFSIWLRVDEAILLQRVTRNKANIRPLLKENPPKALHELLAVRTPLYSTADLIVDCDSRPVAQTANQIIEALQALLEFQIR